MTQMFQQTWPRCQLNLQQSARDTEVVESTCDYLLSVLENLPEASEIFIQLQ